MVCVGREGECVCVWGGMFVVEGGGYPYIPADKKQKLFVSILRFYFSTIWQCWGVWLLGIKRAHLSDFSLHCVLVELVNQISEQMWITLVSSGSRAKGLPYGIASPPSGFVVREDIWDPLPYRKAAEKSICQLRSKLTGVGRKIQSMSICALQRNLLLVPTMWVQCNF